MYCVLPYTSSYTYGFSYCQAVLTTNESPMPLSIWSVRKWCHSQTSRVSNETIEESRDFPTLRKSMMHTNTSSQKHQGKISGIHLTHQTWLLFSRCLGSHEGRTWTTESATSTNPTYTSSTSKTTTDSCKRLELQIWWCLESWGKMESIGVSNWSYWSSFFLGREGISD